jgi:nitroimidazol reductase NimA-like FMN-containing flavoprotein (pyridoxamine 5'-phosphate oxidase superfamily)
MGFRDLTNDEITAVLERERVIRIGFSDGADQFIVPVFYTLYQGALCGLTIPGRKTRLGAANPNVAFQVDSTLTTGPWEWESVSGQGTWEEVPDPAEFGPFAMQLRQELADSPAWAAQLLQERFAKFGMVAWRIRPTATSGRAHEP